jgi:hypothetical protein
MFQHWHTSSSESVNDILDSNLSLWVFEDLNIRETMQFTTNHTSIDRAERDLSNDVSFTHNTCFGVSDRSTHFTIACI